MCKLLKKRLALVLAVVVFVLAGCGGSAQPASSAAPAASSQAPAAAPASSSAPAAEPSAADKWPEKNITWYSASAGGTVDTNFRALAKVLEPHLGVSIVHVNASTVTNQDEMLKQPADGYSFSAMLLPDLYNYKNPANSGQHSIEDFQFVANIISEPAALAIHPDDKRFGHVEDLAGLIEWCKANPSENVLVAVGPVANNHDITLRLIIKESGCENLKIINTDGGIAARKATFLGNHVDAYIGNAGDASQLAADGTAKVLAVFGDVRSSVLPDVPTALEQGINIVYGGHRGMVCHPDVDPAIAAKMAEALEWAIEQPEYIELMKVAGQETSLVTMDDYDKMAWEQDTLFEDLIPMFGW